MYQFRGPDLFMRLRHRLPEEVSSLLFVQACGVVAAIPVFSIAVFVFLFSRRGTCVAEKLIPRNSLIPWQAWYARVIGRKGNTVG